MVMTVILVMIAVVAALGAVGIWLGAGNRAVFYTSGWDVFVSLVSMYAALAALLALSWGMGDQDDGQVMMAAYAVVGLAVIYNYAKSFRYNGWLRGMCVFCGRIVMPVVAILAVPVARKDKDGRTDAVSATVALGIFVGVVALISHLINGDEMLNERDLGENERI